MAKLVIDRASIFFGKKNREIFIPNREIGIFSLFYQKSGGLPKNRETWKLCCTCEVTAIIYFLAELIDNQAKCIINLTDNVSVPETKRNALLNTH